MSGAPVATFGHNAACSVTTPDCFGQAYPIHEKLYRHWESQSFGLELGELKFGSRDTMLWMISRNLESLNYESTRSRSTMRVFNTMHRSRLEGSLNAYWLRCREPLAMGRKIFAYPGR